MRIGGLQKFSLIDYPDRPCAIIFTLGCNFRCSYCHNPELVLPEKFGPEISEKTVLEFLEKRKKQLGAVTITGGEPTIQPDLVSFVKKIRRMGYLIKLDSNGSHPDVLERLLKPVRLIDYLAMDIKAPLKRYREVSHSGIEGEKIKRSIELIKQSGIAYEFRTTVVKGQLVKKDLEEIGQMIKGAKLYYLQKFIPIKTNDPRFLSRVTYSNAEFEKFRRLMEKRVERCEVR